MKEARYKKIVYESVCVYKAKKQAKLIYIRREGVGNDQRFEFGSDLPQFKIPLYLQNRGEMSFPFGPDQKEVFQQVLGPNSGLAILYYSVLCHSSPYVIFPQGLLKEEQCNHHQNRLQLLGCLLKYHLNTAPAHHFQESHNYCQELI